VSFAVVCCSLVCFKIRNPHRQTNGSLLLNIRDAYQSSGSYARILTRSDDGGDTWSAPWRNPTLTMTTCQGSTISYDAVDPNTNETRKRFLFSSPLDILQRTTGFIRASADDGETFWIQNPRIDDPSSNYSGFGYSGLVDLGPADANVDPNGRVGIGIDSDSNVAKSSAAAPGTAGSRQIGIIYEPEALNAIVFKVQIVPP